MDSSSGGMNHQHPRVALSILSSIAKDVPYSRPHAPLAWGGLMRLHDHSGPPRQSARDAYRLVKLTIVLDVSMRYARPLKGQSEGDPHAAPLQRLQAPRRHRDTAVSSLPARSGVRHPVSDLHRAESKQLCAQLHLLMDGKRMEVRVQGSSMYAKLLDDPAFQAGGEGKLTREE